MAAEGEVHPADEVSDAFVQQYFHVLGNLPEQARRLYVDQSVVSRPGPDGKMLSFTSVEAINEQIISCNYRNATFEVISVDSQNSLENGIFIMVMGFFTGEDKLRRKFSQSFYLARRDSVYVVINDILRYVDNEPSSPISPRVTEPAPVIKTAEPVDEPINPEPVSEIDTSVVENSKNVAEVTPPLDNGEVEHSDGKADTDEKTTEPVAEAIAPKALPDSTKRSFAAIVQSMAQNSAPFQVKVPAVRPKPTGQPRAPTPQASASVASSEKKNDQKIIDEPGTSIFVANLPMNAMPAQLHELFKEFGSIKENGIQVRSSRGSGICYGFVAFESTSSVQSVLQAAKASPFVLGDRKLRVKEKLVDYEGSKPSGRNGGGSRTQNSSGDSDESKRHDNAGSRNRRYGSRNGHDRRGYRNAANDVNHQKANPDNVEATSASSASASTPQAQDTN